MLINHLKIAQLFDFPPRHFLSSVKKIHRRINIMNKKYLKFIVILSLLITSGCGLNGFDLEDNQNEAAKSGNPNDSSGCNSPKGGRFSEVKFTQPLDNILAEKGHVIADAKCGPCHKLTDEKLIGPGWKGITQRRSPQWIMNFITYTCPELHNNPHPQSDISICDVRTPRPYITDTQAREILEFMRRNDLEN
jgi:hypothetical protein